MEETERREKREERKWPPAKLTALLQDPRRAGGCRKESDPRKTRGTSAKRSEKRETREERKKKREEKTITINMKGLTKAIVRSHNGEAQDRVDWKRDG